MNIDREQLAARTNAARDARPLVFNKTTGLYEIAQSAVEVPGRLDAIAGIRLPTRSHRPLVTFVLDDTPDLDATLAFPIFDAKGAVGVCAAIWEVLTGERNLSGVTGSLTPAQLLERQAMGWEIASHSSTHGHMAAVDDEEILRYEAITSHDGLTSMGFIVRSYVYPYGEWNWKLRRILRERYRCGVTTGHTEADWHLDLNPGIGVDRVEPYKLHRFSLDTSVSLEQAKAQVDLAIANNRWLIFMIHSWISENETNLFTWLDDLIQYIQDEGVEIVTLDRGWDIFGAPLETTEHTDPDKFGLLITEDGQYHLGNFDNYPRRGRIIYSTTVTPDTPEGDFERHATTIRPVPLAGLSGLPTTGAGIFKTETYGDGYHSHTFQTWRQSFTNALYVRARNSPDTGWTPWQRVMVAGIDLPFQLTTGATGSTLPNQFTSGRISVQLVGFGGMSGAPASGAGQLITYHYAAPATWAYTEVFQEWVEANTGFVWRRSAANSGGSAWTPWYRQARARTSASFTIDLPSINAGATYKFQSTNSVFTNFRANLPVIATPQASIEDGLIWCACSYGNGGIELRVTNTTGSTIDPVSRTWVFQQFE